MPALNSQAKLQILKNFYALDSLIFGKHIKAFQVKENLASEYVTTKGSLLCVLVEMMKLLEYSPKKKVSIKAVTPKVLSEMAKASAVESRKRAVMIISSQRGRDSVKRKLMETSSEMGKNQQLSDFVKESINKQALSIAIDRLLLLPVVAESKKLKKHSTWEGKIVEDSYKILRDSLIEVSTSIMNE
jgi:hypothetical protein